MSFELGLVEVRRRQERIEVEVKIVSKASAKAELKGRS